MYQDSEKVGCIHQGLNTVLLSFKQDAGGDSVQWKFGKSDEGAIHAGILKLVFGLSG